MIQKGYNSLWPVTIYLDTIDLELVNSLCLELLVVLEENLDRTPRTHPITFDNSNIFDMDNPVINEFKQVVDQVFEKYLKDVHNISLKEKSYYYKSWVAKYTSGRGMPSHDHPDSEFSAVFYLIADSNDNGGDIIFFNPSNKEELVRHKPNTGDVVIFPSHVSHEVEVFNGHIRMALPVDLFLE